ncbi:hypothetical protein [Iningainema tapete]|uniref:PEP-CTERM sorting domain-containing protein n=1 Tax=Iningainema tapete BLCC-T55 TaxID=2748662 RepID=A0A8J7BY11_9CYAN|nr:hypothetical protein [Iningainema tapete]MBD2773643.1 hypothetical protein [Iningainema tapete BLCC-T55]
MKQYLANIKHALQIATPIVTGSVLVASPSQAATFAFSQGDFEFSNFSQSPLEVETETDVDAVAIDTGKNNMVQAQGSAQASFVISPPEAINFSISEALGEGRNYIGEANSEARVIGKFFADAGTPFSFDFAANLNLQTSIDDRRDEIATGAGDVSFLLLDTNKMSVLDFFSLFGNLTTPDDADFVALETSDNITISNLLRDANFEGNQEFATVSVAGSLKRTFAERTDFTLVEVKRNQARVVSTPEPSTHLALLLYCGSAIGVVAYKSKRKITAA